MCCNIYIVGIHIEPERILKKETRRQELIRRSNFK